MTNDWTKKVKHKVTLHVQKNDNDLPRFSTLNSQSSGRMFFHMLRPLVYFS